jgi:hypothetical protein
VVDAARSAAYAPSSDALVVHSTWRGSRCGPGRTATPAPRVAWPRRTPAPTSAGVARTRVHPDPPKGAAPCERSTAHRRDRPRRR